MRRALLGGALFMLLSLNGCGWEPLYADPAAGPVNVDLRVESHPVKAVLN